MVVCTVISMRSIYAIDLNALVSGASSVKSDVDKLTEAFNTANATLDKAKLALKNKDKSAKERAQIAAQALLHGIDAINKLITAFNTLDESLIKADLPFVTQPLKDKVQPRLKELTATATQVIAALSFLNGLVQ